MLIIYPDSNALFSDPLLQSEPGEKVLASLKPGQIEVLLSPVVCAELKRQVGERFEEFGQSSAASIEKLFKRNAAAGRALNGSVTDVVARSIRAFESDWQDLVDREGILVAGYPAADAESLARRDLQRRRPFLEQVVRDRRYSTGMRDSLIWEGLLEVARTLTDDDHIVFVTDDGGFLTSDKSALHEHLIEDLGNLRLPRARVSHAANLFHLAVLIDQERARIDAAEARALDTASLALAQLEGAKVGLQLSHGGEYEVPDEYAELDLPSSLEEAHIAAIDQIGEASLMITDRGFEVTIPASLTIEGAMTTFDYYSDDPSAFELWEVLNDRYVWVAGVENVAVVMKIEGHDESLEVVGHRVIPRPEPKVEDGNDSAV